MNKKHFTDEHYAEVKLDVKGYDKNYTNPLTKVFQYEYALFLQMSALFEKVICRSRNIENLKLYFLELPKGSSESRQPEGGEEKEEKEKKTREKFLKEVGQLVARDVAGQVEFPMMHVCTAYMQIIPEEDGTHTFVFSDGIYTFSVHMVMQKGGRPLRIETKNDPCSARIKKSGASL